MLSNLEIVSLVLILFSALGISSVFFFYPCLVWILSVLIGKPPLYEKQISPRPVSIIIPIRGDLSLLPEKLKSLRSLTYPNELLEVIVCFDDEIENVPENIINAFPTAKFISLGKKMGKAFALNKAVEVSTGELLLFTDADAILAPDTIQNLIIHFHDPHIGGISGRRVIGEVVDHIAGAQILYIDLDSFIKEKESIIGSTTGNDGKLYIIRRDHFEPIDPKSTDDLFCMLTIIRKGSRFVYEKNALAFIKKPSRTFLHEVERRRRIVSGSFNAMWLNRSIFNPFRYRFYSFSLFVNKVLRRLLGLFFAIIFISSYFLSPKFLTFKMVFLLQVAFCLFSISHPIISYSARKVKQLGIFSRISAVGLYFIAGCIGSTLGIVDFLFRDSPHSWEPKKS